MEMLASAWPGPHLPSLSPKHRKVKNLKSLTQRACLTPLTLAHGRPLQAVGHRGWAGGVPGGTGGPAPAGRVLRPHPGLHWVPVWSGRSVAAPAPAAALVSRGRWSPRSKGLFERQN